MSEWKPIESAPMDGSIIVSHWGDCPVFVAWCEVEPTTRVRRAGRWPFAKKSTEVFDNSGWRVLMFSRDQEYAIHGNYAPYFPTHWMPLPHPPIGE